LDFLARCKNYECHFQLEPRTQPVMVGSTPRAERLRVRQKWKHNSKTKVLRLTSDGRIKLYTLNK